MNVPLRAQGACPFCERPLEDADGHRIRPLDIDFEARTTDLDRQVLRRIGVGCAWVAGISCLAAVFPPAALVTIPVVVLFQLIYARLAIVAPYRRHFGAGRKVVTRWISRFGMASGAGFHIPAAALVPFNIALSPLLFAALCGALWGYHRWHLGRERERLPVMLFERVLLWVAALVFVLAVAAVVGLILLLDVALG